MSYPVEKKNVLLVNSVTASTTINLVDGMQVSKTVFSTAAGDLGTVTLSPVQPSASNIEYKAGKQSVQISNISFRAAFGLDQGQVTTSGTATDQDGNNEAPFNKQICSWNN